MTQKINDVRVLIIEDDDDDAFLIKRQLQKMTRFNAQVDTEHAIDSGLETAVRGDYDAVFLDFYWGEGTSDALLSRQKTRMASVPIVVVTSTDDFAVNERVVESGAWDFIAKNDLSPKLLERTILHTLERKRHEHELHRLIRHDSLTGLGNRLMFEEQLQRSTSRADRMGSRCAVLALDLDDFKHVNDTLGHDVGDMLLRLVADRLERGLRAEDTLARLGGDEFAILIEDFQTGDDLEAIALKLLESLREPTPIKGISGKITGSFGIAIYPDNARSTLEMMRYADIALYSAKDGGRDRVSLFNNELEQKLISGLEMEHELRQSIEKGDLVPFFQPRYGCKDRELYGVEVLMRWQHPTRGVVLPGEFLPVAEKAGFLLQMDRTLICNTLETLAIHEALPNERHPYKIAFNITAAQLLDGEFPEEMLRQASRFNVDPRHIEFEITEGVLVERRARETLVDLRNMGFGLAIDDFGTGFSSFSYLRDLPVSVLKLDRSFVADLAECPASRGICEAIVCVGKRLGLLVIGEGVETQSQMDCLRDFGVDSVQGFMLSHPLPADDWIVVQKKLKTEAIDDQ